LHLCPTFQTTTGFLSWENWRRWAGSFPEWRPYRKGSEASMVPQYNFEIPIILKNTDWRSAFSWQLKFLAFFKAAHSRIND
jgi:hypothetical protein